jgi:hypothetical protein
VDGFKQWKAARDARIAGPAPAAETGIKFTELPPDPKPGIKWTDVSSEGVAPPVGNAQRTQESREAGMLPAVPGSDGYFEKPSAPSTEAPRITGKLIEVSEAGNPVPYRGRDGARPTHYAIIETPDGKQHEVWGDDVNRAVVQASKFVDIGDTVTAQSIGHQTVRTTSGTVREQANVWVIEKAENFEAARAAILERVGRDNAQTVTREQPPRASNKWRNDQPKVGGWPQGVESWATPESAKSIGQSQGNTVEHVARAPQTDKPQTAKRRRQATQSKAPKVDANGDDRTQETIARMTAAELDAYTKAGNDRKQAESILKSAEQRIDSEVNRPTSFRAALEDRFNVVSRFGRGHDYYYREKPGRLAFSERWVSMSVADDSPAAIGGFLDRMEERGWQAFKITKGTLEFKRQAWIGASARGIAASGYEPTQGDRAIAEEERARLAKQRGIKGPAVGEGGTVKQAAEAGGSVVKQAVREQAIKQQTPAEQRAMILSVLEASFEATNVPVAKRDAVRKAVGEEIDRRQAHGEKIAVAVYDHEAPAHNPPAPVKAQSQKQAHQHEWTR